MVDQSGFTVNYAYDAVGRLSTLTDGSGNLIVKYTYDPTGRLSRKDTGNGTYTVYEYGVNGDLLHLINYAPDGTVNSQFDYTYDALGRRTTETTLDGQWTYSYDAIGELTHAVFVSTNPAIANQDLAYSYDAAGNRTQTVINGVTTAYTVNNLNEYTQVGGATYGYDADGNMTSATDASGTTTYAYNALNQMTSISGPSGSWTYQYDAFGNRVAATSGGQTTGYLIDPAGLGNVVGTYDGSGSLIADYTYGLGLTSQRDRSGGAGYYDFDAIGSTVGISGPAGGYVNAYSYLPFGETMMSSESVANPFQFVGQWSGYAAGNDLTLMGARYYSSFTGHFFSQDPLGIQGGASNLYGYVGNDPIHHIDPLGLDSFDDALANTLDEEGQQQSHRTQQILSNLNKFGQEATQYVADSYIDYPALPGRAGKIQKTVENLQTLDQTDTLLQHYRILLNQINSSSQPADTHPPNPVAVLLLALITKAVTSHDPNALYGPAGVGPQGFVAPSSTFPYRITFENDPTASAPAQRVDITDQLDSNLDWSTFQLTGLGFGDTNLPIQPGLQHFADTVPMTYNGQTFDVQIVLDFDPVTGLFHASFQSVDPATSLPPDVLTGFLPP